MFGRAQYLSWWASYLNKVYSSREASQPIVTRQTKHATDRRRETVWGKGVCALFLSLPSRVLISSHVLMYIPRADQQNTDGRRSVNSHEKPKMISFHVTCLERSGCGWDFFLRRGERKRKDKWRRELSDLSASCVVITYTINLGSVRWSSSGWPWCLLAS